ncbi:MAG: aspartate kinase [Bacteroidota bacterium]|nr:aspartate kinase [Bacteroidota bacterium]
MTSKIFVEKFGGASVNSAKAVENVKHILQLSNKKRIVVISAMGKTTNALEEVVNLWYKEKKLSPKLEEIALYHTQLLKQLFPKKEQFANVSNILNNIIEEIKTQLNNINSNDYNFLYDSIVSFGEKISTSIISNYLNFEGVKNKLLFACDIIRTDNNYRNATVLWEETKNNVATKILPLISSYDTIIIQGFIGGTKEGLSTTLGREGSDYSASILAHCVKAESLTIWKDVPGLLNADPKRIKQTTKIISLPYREAIELSYYGASIIHPKTIKPLENINIPLFIKSFIHPEEKGSVICNQEEIKPKVTNYIFKDNQILLSISPKDFSFIDERNMALVYNVLAKNNIKVNLMQNSAISFSVCFDENVNILPKVLEDLKTDFNVKYNTNLQLITLRHYNQEAMEDILKDKTLLIEQKNRTTVQYLVEK